MIRPRERVYFAAGLHVIIKMARLWYRFEAWAKGWYCFSENQRHVLTARPSDSFTSLHSLKTNDYQGPQTTPNCPFLSWGSWFWREPDGLFVFLFPSLPFRKLSNGKPWFETKWRQDEHRALSTEIDDN